MKLEKGKLFAVKLTDSRIESILTISELLQINPEDSATIFFDALMLAFLNNVNESIAAIKEEKEVKEEIKQPELTKVNISKPEFKLSDKLSNFHKQLIDQFINNSDIIKDFSEMNKNGKLNGVFNPINTEDYEENILNLLTGVFTGSANHMILKKGVISRDQLKKSIKNYIELDNE
jgi:hypothetical protein